ncbi:MAG: dihydroorotate dehydrogenase electron transfer subunit [Nanoarchaeota archaeon]
MTEQPKIMIIDSVKEEAHGIKTFTFQETINALPGQFIMLWLPRVNMKPFGVSYQDEKSFSVTVSNVGEFTNELFKKGKGDKVGIQGPYGNGFSVDKKNVVLVAGGYGTAPLAFLAEELEKTGVKVRIIIGAKSKEQLVYLERFENTNIKPIFSTDDGSYGQKGFTTDVLKEVLEKDKTVDFVYTVGPEIMMKKVIEITDKYNVGCEASLERYMKCGFGVCGQCCVDETGERVCKTGPVYNKSYIKKYITEFGKYKRDGKGKIEKI